MDGIFDPANALPRTTADYLALEALYGATNYKPLEVVLNSAMSSTSTPSAMLVPVRFRP